jgi:hypothetical protein
VATETDILAYIRPHDLPCIAFLQPLVGLLDLPPVADFLIEHAELVTNPVADGRHLKRGQRIHVTGGQPSEAAVAKAGLFFEHEQFVEVLPEREHRVARGCLDAKVDQVAAELRSDQKFGRQIARDLHIASDVGLRCAYPARQHPVAHAVGECHVPVVGGGDVRVARPLTGQVVENRALQRVFLQPGAT